VKIDTGAFLLRTETPHLSNNADQSQVILRIFQGENKGENNELEASTRFL
jgi:hypothetical protein